MRMANYLFNPLSSSFLCFCILFSISRNIGVHTLKSRNIGENEHHLQLQVRDFLPSATCKISTAGKRNVSLKVVHKHGPCSHLSENVAAPNLSEALFQDQARVDAIQSKMLLSSNRGDLINADGTKLPTSSGASLGTGNYIVTVGLGTPTKELPLIFDTGSDFTWTRCTSKDQFDPIQSTSYSNISCGSPPCSHVSEATGNAPECSSSTCIYGIEYGDGSYSVGFLGKEKLSLGTTDTFDDFYFGCGQDNDGLFGDAAGLLGLGQATLSIVSQTETMYKKLFSYCLPVSSSSTGFLSFGASISNSAEYTPLSTKYPSSTFYDLDLIGITVGGENLSVTSSDFSSGTIIDSGTVITRLPPLVYSNLRSAFRAGMSKYPRTQPLSILDTCYDFSNYTTIDVPNISLSFNGGTQLVIDVQGVFIVNGVEQVCLAFAGNNNEGEIAIIGNTQQKSFEVIYDVGNKQVGFAPGAC
ncbi:Eukaryotic aspartyl protease family protein [Euphorbia peplus]|nr:Eukaryotic aspartyl protease family protein [Euphorbia peplus]